MADVARECSNIYATPLHAVGIWFGIYLRMGAVQCSLLLGPPVGSSCWVLLLGPLVGSPCCGLNEIVQHDLDWRRMF
jgi:hypothetical protein